MNQDRRHSLFHWLLGVPGTLVQITGWFLVLLSLGKISEGADTPPLLLAAAFILSIATFLVGRLMSLACDLLTGTLTVPENKRPCGEPHLSALRPAPAGGDGCAADCSYESPCHVESGTDHEERSSPCPPCRQHDCHPNLLRQVSEESEARMGGASKCFAG